MALYEVTIVNNMGSHSVIIDAETKPNKAEMNTFLADYMNKTGFDTAYSITEISKEVFDRWNKREKMQIFKYIPKKNNTSTGKNMIQAKCIQKFRDSKGKIYGYRLIDLNGQTQDVRPENLKKAIANNTIHVVNLTLTSDNRLVDSSEKQLQSKQLGDKPIDKSEQSKPIYVTIANKLAKAVKGDSYKCKLEKGLSNSYDNIIDEFFDTNINYKEHKNIVLGVFIDSENIFISINKKDLDEIDSFSFKIPGGISKHLKEVGTFINECAKQINNSSIVISNLAKAFTSIDYSLIDMGDDYENMVIELRSMANLNTEIDSFNDNIFDKSNEAYQILINEDSPILSDLFSNIVNDEYYRDKVNKKMYAECADKPSNSEVYREVSLICKYFSTRDKKLAKKIKEDMLDKMKENGISSIKAGYEVGHEYFRYLDRNLFGTITNNSFTVGHEIKSSDIKEHKEYKGYNYVLHKDINKCGAPNVSIAALFKNANNGDVQVDIKIERHGYTTESRSCVGIRGYILDVESFILKSGTPKEQCAKTLANKLNNLALKLYDLADIHQSLYSNLDYNKLPEEIRLNDLNSHGTLKGKDLVDLAISRWTTIRGSKTAAKIATMDYRSDTSFGIIYANNVSDYGNDRKLYIKYNGKEITLKVLEGIDINKVVIEKTEAATGSIIDNSPTLSEVIAKALIEANVKKI